MTNDPRDRPCKFDGEPVVYDPREDVTTPKGRYHYGQHDGPCGRKLVLLRLDRAKGVRFDEPTE